MARSIYHLTIPSSTRFLEDARRFVETHAMAAHLDQEAVEQLKVAVDEACTNVIKHAYKGDTANRIDITLIVEPDFFKIRIRDQGQAFDVDKYRIPDIRESIKQRRAGGYGVHIMRRLMDSVEYRSCGKTNEVCMTKYRGSNPSSNGETSCCH